MQENYLGLDIRGRKEIWVKEYILDMYEIVKE